MDINQTLIALNRPDADPETIAASMSVDQLVALLRYAKQCYETTSEPVMTDPTYDVLLDLLQQREPDHPFFREVEHADAPPEVAQHHMFSLDKLVKGQKGVERKLSRWLEQFPGPWCLSDKADGLTSRVEFTDGQVTNVFTHNLTLTHAVPYFRKLFKRDRVRRVFPGNVALRGECCIPRRFLDEVKKIRGQKIVNLRSVVCGLLISKPNKFRDNPVLPYLRFYGFEAMDQPVDESHVKPLLRAPWDQFQTMRRAGIPTVHAWLVEDMKRMSISHLCKELQRRNNDACYNIDGVVMIQNRRYRQPTDRNPEYARAFKSKVIEMTRNVRVKEIEWSKSDGGFYIPVACFEPVWLETSEVRRCSLHNARFVQNNQINVGALIRIRRSGGSIPTVDAVLEPVEATFPKDAEWNKTRVHMKYKQDENDIDVIVMRLTHFFEVLKTTGLRKSTIQKIVGAGLTTVQRIVTATKEDFLNVKGCAARSAESWVQAIRVSLAGATPVQLMHASSCFSRGDDEVRIAEKKLQRIVNAIPRVLDLTYTPDQTQLEAVNGIATKTAVKFLSALPRYRKFIKQNPCLQHVYDRTTGTNATTPEPTNNRLKGQTIVLSGTRDRKLIQAIERAGGTVGGSVTSRTTLVVAKDPNKESQKVKAARDRQIRVMSLADFRREFLDESKH